ncbi:MAG: hypothetical protein Q4F81_02630, partial [Eubacteriales bacterium]|nr:hypothetical protein [Eubacteriales bacterium]
CPILGRGQSKHCPRPNFFRQLSPAFATTFWQVLQKAVEFFSLIFGIALFWCAILKDSALLTINRPNFLPAAGLLLHFDSPENQ